MRFLIAYDIAHPRRLRRVARCLERHAVRTQKSVFLFTGDFPSLEALLAETALLLDLKEDCVQAWLLSKHQPARGRVCGTAQPLDPAAAVLCAGQPCMIERRLPTPRRCP